MTIASDFISMAKEMLDDPEIGMDGSLIARVKITPDPDKPWQVTVQEGAAIPLRLFYTDSEKKTVNGSVVESGERVFITYQPDEIELEAFVTNHFVDHKGKKWTVNAVEITTAGNETIIAYVKIGA